MRADLLPLRQHIFRPQVTDDAFIGLQFDDALQYGINSSEFSTFTLPSLARLFVGDSPSTLAESALVFAYSSERATPNGVPPLVDSDASASSHQHVAIAQRDASLNNLNLLKKFVGDACIVRPVDRLIKALQDRPEFLARPPDVHVDGYLVESDRSSSRSRRNRPSRIYQYYWTYVSSAARLSVRKRFEADRQVRFDVGAFPGAARIAAARLADSVGTRRRRRETSQWFHYPQQSEDVAFLMFEPDRWLSRADALVARVWTDAVRQFVWSG